MIKRVYYIAIFLLSFFANTQEITILDKDANFAIPDVLVSNKNKSKSAVSNIDGVIDLSIFATNDELLFYHISYKQKTITKTQALQQGKVYLQNTLQELDEVFLSASKGKESRKRIAEQVAVVSIKEIQKMTPQTSADMLAEIPGIKVQKSQFGGGSPVLRGMEANRVLLVVDGVRMNNAIYRKGHLQNSITVSPNMLERTEVIFGPSSVVYGSDALGGVIHYYTKQPKISENNAINGSFLTRYSTVNNEKTLQGGLELQFPKFATYTSVSYSNFGDLLMGKNRQHGFNDWGKVYHYSNNTNTYYNENMVKNSNPDRQKNTGYKQVDFLQKFFIPLTENTNLNINFQYGNSSKIPRFDKLTEKRDGVLRFAEWYYGPQKRMLVSSQLKINPEKKWIKNGTITAAYQNIEESRINRRFTSNLRTTRTEKLNIFSVNGDFFTPLTSDNKRILSYGIELNHNDVESIPKGEVLDIVDNQILGVSDTYAVQARYADGGSKYTSFAAYVNYRQDISKNSTLNSGLRYTNTLLSAKWIDETFIKLPNNHISTSNSAVTATLGYVYKPTKTWQINGVISSGFRSPNIDDVGKVREKNNDITVPNINLKPEYAYNGELGISKYFSNKKSYLGITGYYTLLKNYITRDNFILNGQSTIVYDGDEGNIVANVNKNNAYIIGGTFNSKIQLNSNFNTQGSLTLTKGKAYDTNEYLSSIPPLFGRIAFNYEKEKLELGINMRFNAEKRANKYNVSEGIDNLEQTPIINPDAILDVNKYYGTPAFSVFNLNGKYSFSKQIDLIANLDNIFNIHYKEFASGVSAPGRNLSLSVLANF